MYPRNCLASVYSPSARRMLRHGGKKREVRGGAIRQREEADEARVRVRRAAPDNHGVAGGAMQTMTSRRV